MISSKLLPAQWGLVHSFRELELHVKIESPRLLPCFSDSEVLCRVQSGQGFNRVSTNLLAFLLFHCIPTMNHAEVHQINSFLSCVCAKTFLLFGKSVCRYLFVVPGHLSMEAAGLLTTPHLSHFPRGCIILAF